MRQLVYTSLLLAYHAFSYCGERKICSTIKKSQNIMNMIAVSKKWSNVRWEFLTCAWPFLNTRHYGTIRGFCIDFWGLFHMTSLLYDILLISFCRKLFKEDLCTLSQVKNTLQQSWKHFQLLITGFPANYIFPIKL